MNSKRGASREQGGAWRDLERPWVVALSGLGALGALVTLLTALGTGPSWLRWGTLAGLIVLVCVCLVGAHAPLYRLFTWLTWKFALGLLVGAAIGAVAIPPAVQQIGLSLQHPPQIGFLESTPASGGTLATARSSIVIRFAKDIPDRYLRATHVEIVPHIDTTHSWSHDSLFISPDGRFPSSVSEGFLNPRFEYDTQYTVTVTAPYLVSPVVLVVHTPEAGS